MNILDRVKKIQESRGSGGNFTKTRGIFFKFEDGDNVIRLFGGDLLQVKTHYIAPAPKRNDRGLCVAEAFQGEERLPFVVNCHDWDQDAEKKKSEKTCPICKLNRIAHHALKVGGDDLTSKEKDFLENLRRASNATTAIKWNIIDRANPNVTEISDSGEKEVLGLKIASFGMEAWRDIGGIFTQLEVDISDPDEGCDICVKRGHNGVRTSYKAQPVMDGMKIAQTPLTEEERALEPHDLRKICGKMTDIDLIVDNLHDDLREIYNSDEAGGEEEEGGDDDSEPHSSEGE